MTYAERLSRAATAAAEAGIDALLVTPGPDLRYLVGYDAIPLERLTCLVVPASGDPLLVVPLLERPAALASPVGALGVDVLTWGETEDPFSTVAQRLGRVGRVGLDDQMWASRVLRLREVLPQAQQVLAGGVLHDLRMRKDEAEIAALLGAGAAIDRVHAGIGELLRPGRTEREVGADITELILAEGHAYVDFVIVAAGPNGASPHHDVSDRPIGVGEPIVIDIGGTMPDGYCSDSTRMYCIDQPTDEYLADYAVLQAAQAAAVAAVRPGITAHELDAVARSHLSEYGLGEAFVHRTGHGIGLETHEEPYIVAGSERVLEAGMAFSIEPGFYLEGRYGARIEDIVVCGPDGPIVANARPHDLIVV